MIYRKCVDIQNSCTTLIYVFTCTHMFVPCHVVLHQHYVLSADIGQSQCVHVGKQGGVGFVLSEREDATSVQLSLALGMRA